MDNNASFTISTSANIVVAKQSDYLGVNKADWNRLKKKVNSCKYKTDWWMNIGFTLFGIAGSALLSYFTLPFSNNTVWVAPTLICIGASSLVIGIICLLAHSQKRHFDTSSVNDIKEVIEEIENCFLQIDTE